MLKRQEAKTQARIRNNPDSGFCVGCGTYQEKIVPTQKCPYCGTIANQPCLNKNQVEVSINWKELVMLCSAAENFLISRGLRPDVVYSIVERLEKQYPLKEPLSVKGALLVLQKSGMDISNVTFPKELLIEDEDVEKIKRGINWNG